jgi:hypothetical protein
MTELLFQLLAAFGLADIPDSRRGAGKMRSQLLQISWGMIQCSIKAVYTQFPKYCSVHGSVPCSGGMPDTALRLRSVTSTVNSLGGLVYTALRLRSVAHAIKPFCGFV